MFKRLFSWLVSRSCLLGLRKSSRSFNGPGHMTVASLAYKKLKPETKRRVNDLLKLNPYYGRWQRAIPNDVSQEERDRRTFMFASMWADDIKRDKNYVSDRIESGDSPELAATPSDYSDMRMHKYWHYVNYPFSNDGTELPPVVTPNLETQLNELRQVIAADFSEEQKSYALTWLLHLVGDAHQPLHSSARVSQTEKNGDMGGNKVFVIVNGRNSKLHFFWDDVLGAEKRPERVHMLADALPPEDPELSAKVTAKDWLMESFEACKTIVYTAPIGEGAGPFTITDEYIEKSKTFAKKRISLAGARLAKLLNEELK